MRPLVIVLLVLATAAPAGASSRDQSAAARLDATEQSLLVAVNAARAANGLSPLSADRALENAARAHTRNLLANGAFTHDFVDLGAPTPFGTWIWRYYRGTCAGENLATGWPALTPDQAVQMWLGSPGHRANMLSKRFTTVGVSLLGQNGVWIATTDFGGC